MFSRFFTVSLCLVVASCASNPQLQPLLDKNAELEAQLVEAKQHIDTLNSEKHILAADNTELKRVMAILTSEKSSRVEESSELRLQARRFAQGQIDQLKDFLVRSNLLDYVGEELFDRTKMDEKPAVLVDFANPMPRKGALIGVNGFFSQPTSLVVNILRPVNGRFVVIWQSETVVVTTGGTQRIRFPVSIGVEKGDVVAYDFAEGVGVKYDYGTGSTLLANKSFALGAVVSESSLKFKKERRAYSLGVNAILE